MLANYELIAAVTPPSSPALCELFDKADVTKDGTISFAEYQAMCDEYGVKLSAEDRVAIKAIADEDGEVRPESAQLTQLQLYNLNSTTRFIKTTSSCT